MEVEYESCPQCGGTIEVDNTLEAGICKYCHTPFVTEKVINNYNVNIQNAVFNVSGVKVENLKKLGNEKIKKRHYPFEMDEYIKAQDYFSKVLEYEDNEEYKLKNCLCDRINHPDRISAAQIPTIIDEVIEYIKSDIEKTKNDVTRYSVYADFIRLMDEATEVITSNLYDRFQAGGLNTSVYVSVFLNLVKKKIECANFLSKYKDNADISKEAFLLCRTCEGYLASLLPVYVPNLSQDTYAEMRNLAEQVQTTGRIFDNTYSVRNDIMSETGSGQPNNSSTNSSGGCYIATAVYGSYDCPEVWTLRRYRDYRLSKYFFGRVFIKTYYAVSPTIVKLFGNSKAFQGFWKNILNTKVHKLNSMGYDSTPYND